MKKIISVLMVAVCLMMAAPAQAQLHFGVKGGLNISKLSFSKDAFKIIFDGEKKLTADDIDQRIFSAMVTSIEIK